LADYSTEKTLLGLVETLRISAFRTFIHHWGPRKIEGQTRSVPGRFAARPRHEFKANASRTNDRSDHRPDRNIRANGARFSLSLLLALALSTFTTPSGREKITAEALSLCTLIKLPAPSVARPDLRRRGSKQYGSAHDLSGSHCAPHDTPADSEIKGISPSSALFKSTSRYTKNSKNPFLDPPKTCSEWCSESAKRRITLAIFRH
jgi:hypothetical protein